LTTASIEWLEVALPAFGMIQASLLVGPMHWIIRVLHLLMGLAAMAVAGMLGQAILAAVPGRVRGSARKPGVVTS
jgi:hypothetical protein